MNRNELKWIIDLNVKPKTTTLLEQNAGGDICDQGLGKALLDGTWKERPIEEH